MMKLAAKAYDGLIQALAILAGVLSVLMFVMIVADVIAREVFARPFKFTIGTVEYMMLYMTCFAAPWLLRTHGHVYIEAFVSRLHGAAKRFTEAMVYVLSIAAASIFAWISFTVLQEKIFSGVIDMRDIDIPGWLIIAPLPLCYGLIAIECLLYLLGKGSVWRDDGAPPEAL
ncbi:MAG: TRAP transporter small permease [Alphaproteobacteria bacterium]|nr:TRAP transporter small permease [Alphaproteobacteria bacterium]